jgi:hypothetical protein
MAARICFLHPDSQSIGHVSGSHGSALGEKSGRQRYCRPRASAPAKPGLTWAFSWQVLDSNQGRLTSTVLHP